MTENEAIQELERASYNVSISQGYAINMAIAALEKQIPKKILNGKINGHLECGYHCPNCEEYYDKKIGFEYCPICGQRIDWSDEE